MKIVVRCTLLGLLLWHTAAQAGASKQIDSLRTLLANTAQDTSRVSVLNELSYAYHTVDPDSGLALAQEAVALATELKSETKLLRAYYNVGINRWARSEFAEALASYGAAWNLALKTNSATQKVKIKNSIGVVYKEMGDFPTAQTFFLEALRIAETLNDPSQIASCYTNLGMIQRVLRDYEKAREYDQLALNAHLQINDSDNAASALNNLGNDYSMLEQNDTAIVYYERALRINESLGNKRRLASNHVNLGVIYNWIDRYPEAYDHLQKGLKLYTELGDKNNLSQAYFQLAQTFAGASPQLLATMKTPLSERSNAVVASIQKGLQLAKEAGAAERMSDGYNLLSQHYESEGKFELAYSTFGRYVSLRDSLMNNAKKTAMARQQMQFEFEKKAAATKALHDKQQAVAAAEISRQQTTRNAVIGGVCVLLLGGGSSFVFYKRRRDALEQKRASDFNALVADTEMKALRAQMNPHFIFNSLNSIGDFILRNDLQSAGVYLSKFAKVMRLILENSDRKEIPLADDIHALELYIQLESQRMNNKFSYEIRVDRDIDKDNTLVPPLILQPFVENSIWHGIAKKEGHGKILVHISREGNMINCMVQDNGAGRHRPKDLVTNRPVEKKSLGMKITNARIDILNVVKKSNGSVTLSDLPEGTRVEVRLPLELNF